YAGLFPPASLPLEDVVARYATYARSAAGWTLGRLVLPIQQCDALEAAVAALPDEAFARPWTLAVLGSGSVEDDRQTLTDFAVRQHRTGGRLRVESIELRVASALEVRRARVLAADGWIVYCEAPAVSEGVLDAIAICGLRAKVRAGGVTPEQIPPADYLARMLAGCVQRGISLKATAGLHHAVTGEYPLTYAPESARA
ncbi:MAG: hypothetical protein ACLGHP_10260, partial [Vicinamibacteria bacterium]